MKIPLSLSPHSITKLLAFLSHIEYFKDSRQHWSILMLRKLLKYLWKYDFEAVFAQYCEYLKLLLLKCLVLCKFQLNKDILFTCMCSDEVPVCACMWTFRQAELQPRAYTVSLEVLQISASHSWEQALNVQWVLLVTLCFAEFGLSWVNMVYRKAVFSLPGEDGVPPTLQCSCDAPSNRQFRRHTFGTSSVQRWNWHPS